MDATPPLPRPIEGELVKAKDVTQAVLGSLYPHIGVLRRSLNVVNESNANELQCAY